MPQSGPLERGRYYHIYNRGNNRENLFVEERNYRYFLQLYAHYIEPVAETYAYCLLRNHFHLLVRIKDVESLAQDVSGSAPRQGSGREPDRPGQAPGRAFSNLFNAYAKAINKAYDRTGALFQRPFGRVEVTSDAQFAWLVVYIHRNPQKHHFVDDFRDWPFSSYGTLLSAQPTHLRREEVLGWFDGPAALAALHREGNEEGRIGPLVAEDID
jgi:putative transposase